MANCTDYLVSAEKILRGLMELRDQELLCDVQLVAEDETFPVHRVVLAAASPYFQAMFTGGFKENDMDVVTLKETSAKGLKCVLDAIYTGEVKLTDENVDLVLSVANLMQMNDIVKACETFMVNNITENNCLRLMNISEKFELHQVVDRANKFMLEVSFESFTATSEFNEISKERLCSYLADDRIRLSNGEIEVFRVAVKWIENNSTDTEIDVTSILKHVRFPLIPAELLLDDVMPHCLVEQNEECKSLVKEALRFHCNIFAQPLQVGKQFEPRGEQKLLLMPSGNTRTGYLYTVEETDTKIHFLTLNKDKLLEEDTMNLKTYPMSFVLHSMTVVGTENYLFVFATDNKSFNSVALRYNTITDEWIDLKAPPQPATIGSAVAKSHDKICLLGGMFIQKSDKKRFTERLKRTVLQYSLGTNSWVEKQMMPQPGAFAGAASHANFIYVAGGITAHGNAMYNVPSMYAYDIRANLWLRKADMQQSRSNFSLGKIGDSLYACGGDGNSLPWFGQGVEAYNILNDQWTELQDIPVKHRHGSTCFVKDEKLYIVGGTSSHYGNTGSDLVSCLDVENNTTFKVTNLTFTCVNHAGAVVTAPRT